MMASSTLRGERFELAVGELGFPGELNEIPKPPRRLYGIGTAEALQTGLAVIGARKATPYGRGCARRFARLAAEKGVCIISGGARGCDAEAHRAALDAGGTTVVFLGGGCDRIYPSEHFGLFQSIIEAGGAVVSEHPWDSRPLPYMFRERNRLIAGLSKAVLIVEAGLPSGTFSTADEALAAGKEVLVVPGAITSKSSHGSNRLLYQGAIPVVDDETFEDVLFSVMGVLRRPCGGALAEEPARDPIVEAVLAEPRDTESLFRLALEEYGNLEAREKLMSTLAEAEAARVIARQPDGRWGPAVVS